MNINKYNIFLVCRIKETKLYKERSRKSSLIFDVISVFLLFFLKIYKMYKINEKKNMKKTQNKK